jgi:HSP20 family molecular chaperone IbpA
MPGVSKEQLELKVEGEALWIEGGVRPDTPDGLEAMMPTCGWRVLGAASR